MISVREGAERLNVWVAYLNLENLHGTAESLQAVFTRALQHNDDQLAVYERLGHVFRATKKKEQLLQLCRTMASKFPTETRVWETLGAAYIDQDKREAVRRTIRQIQTHPQLKVADKTLVLQQLGVHEYKAGHPTHGRAMFESLVSQKAKRSDVWNVFLDQELAALARREPSTTVADVRKLFQRASSVMLPPRAMQQLMTRFVKFEQEHGAAADVERVKETAQRYVQDRLATASGMGGGADGAAIAAAHVPQGFTNNDGAEARGGAYEPSSLLDDAGGALADD